MKLNKFVCDRCDAVREVKQPGELPQSWSVILGKELCQKCMGELGDFLRGCRVVYEGVVREESKPQLAALSKEKA